jgi:hypothetical protein
VCRITVNPAPSQLWFMTAREDRFTFLYFLRAREYTRRPPMALFAARHFMSRALASA